MQKLKTVLLFEAMYRYHVLGRSLVEIENELKNYPTQDGPNLVKRVRDELSVDDLNREEEDSEDVNVTEGSKAEYHAFFNKMLQKFGVQNVSELSKENRKKFFNSIDKHWKGKDEKNVNEEIEWTDDVYEEFVQEFKEFADILLLIKEEMQKEVLDEAGKRTTVTRITRQTKIDRAMGSLAMQYARAVNDPMYKKFKKFKDKWMKYKERIQSKYGPRVRTAARQGGGIGGILDKVGKGPESKKKAAKKK